MREVPENLSDDQLAQIIWDFNVSIDHVEPAEIILVLGSHDLRVAHRGIELHKQGFAPKIIFSGGFGRLTAGNWSKPEAQIFAAEAIAQGVAKENILIEDQSTNTGENIMFSWKLLQEHGLNPKSFIVVQKPNMLQRAWATFKKHLPEKIVFVTAPHFTFAEYPNQQITKNDVITIMVGDLQRLQLYPARGFQVPVDIPPNVWDAYTQLVERGYTQQLIADA